MWWDTPTASCLRTSVTKIENTLSFSLRYDATSRHLSSKWMEWWGSIQIRKLRKWLPPYQPNGKGHNWKRMGTSGTIPPWIWCGNSACWWGVMGWKSPESKDYDIRKSGDVHNWDMGKLKIWIGSRDGGSGEDSYRWVGIMTDYSDWEIIDWDNL